MRLEHSHATAGTPVPSLAGNLALLIKKNRITPSQLSQALDLPIMTIRRLLSGETEDPRVSTLKVIADYFDVSIDFLVGAHSDAGAMLEQRVKSYVVPKLFWEDLTELYTQPIKKAQHWESIFISQPVSTHTFALESKPSMHPRFPKGTVFVIDPALSPKDGDIVLIHFKENHDYAFKELIIDPPEMRLNPLVIDSSPVTFQAEQHDMLGVVVVTLFYPTWVE